MDNPVDNPVDNSARQRDFCCYCPPPINKVVYMYPYNLIPPLKYKYKYKYSLEIEKHLYLKNPGLSSLTV